MGNIEIFSKYIPNFLFILLRTSIFVSMLPFFGSKNFPMQFKVGFALSLALIITPVVSFEISENNIPILITKEILLGITLGLAVRFVFMAIEVAGQMASNAMGFSIATVFNPEMGQSTEISRLYGIAAMLLFLAMDAHHDLIYVFVRSYEILPAGQINVKDLMQEGILLVGKMFVIALKICAPAVVGMVIVSLLLGFVYKAAPQINIFFVSFPIYIYVGFLIMFLSAPVFANVTGGYFNEIKNEMQRIIAIAKN
ncbi:MAG: flagellar biosynthetic protein FliR [Nitrospirae bacterium]|nr:flagellar biosynthetic protein FliR [Nitrospirota bacterium]